MPPMPGLFAAPKPPLAPKPLVAFVLPPPNSDVLVLPPNPVLLALFAKRPPLDVFPPPNGEDVALLLVPPKAPKAEPEALLVAGVANKPPPADGALPKADLVPKPLPALVPKPPVFALAAHVGSRRVGQGLTCRGSESSGRVIVGSSKHAAARIRILGGLAKT